MAAINSYVSARQIQRELGISKSTAHRILVTHNFHPCHIALKQDLTPDDFRQSFVIGHKQCCNMIVHSSDMYCLESKHELHPGAVTCKPYNSKNT